MTFANEDYHDILGALVAKNVRFLVVGAHALAAHGYPRATVDIDICWPTCSRISGRPDATRTVPT